MDQTLNVSPSTTTLVRPGNIDVSIPFNSDVSPLFPKTKLSDSDDDQENYQNKKTSSAIAKKPKLSIGESQEQQETGSTAILKLIEFEEVRHRCQVEEIEALHSFYIAKEALRKARRALLEAETQFTDEYDKYKKRTRYLPYSN